jgi:hypothetical protein
MIINKINTFFEKEYLTFPLLLLNIILIPKFVLYKIEFLSDDYFRLIFIILFSYFLLLLASLVLIQKKINKLVILILLVLLIIFSVCYTLFFGYMLSKVVSN